ncbi:AHH domain-containing protein [Saccharophagus degradans]|uniref:AHH domain-containing protein n=1 Tax=Saccharophagus degradans TaxID=86304 RepID=A0AAW7XAF3_9GAMM|nr:AHH domain-containing protein [Saccharophagus degradans]MBU2987046.1 AHH domain-containing protein [Saccharophagus degradans]MDO6423743.1 AHH domain-containing protein [Saccharophagus degradans]MDO6607823.1 AHH domain-containing protein [Saccharophagus degradans]
MYMEEQVSLFDKAVKELERRAEEFYSISSDYHKLPKDIQSQRKASLKRVREHLECQKVNVEIMASIQAKLDEYRAQGLDATIGERAEVELKQENLLNEKHHPTKVLARFMVAACKPRPSPNHSAHHIVPGKGKSRFAYLARVQIHINGVRINDPDNGVWLPSYKKHIPDWALPNSLSHLEYHTKIYEHKVWNRIRGHREKQLRFQLNILGKMLQENTLLPRSSR